IVNPLHLYRSILRTHRLLPQEMRFVGDQYVRAEFRSHRTVTDKRFLDPFFAQWTSYLSLLQEQTKSAAIQQSAGNIGKHLDSDVVDKLGDDKAQQLLELHH
ncbi:ACN9-domain-containing protein, partial [Martensiomyces pterosporus]